MERVALRFDDIVAGTCRRFDGECEVLRADAADELRPVLEEVRSRLASGATLAGFLSYEAGQVLVTQPDGTRWRQRDEGRCPVAWFAVLPEAPRAVPASWPAPENNRYHVGEWEPQVRRGRHLGDVEQVRERIARGDFYQCNLTTQLQSSFAGFVEGLYRDLALAQQSGHCAFIETDDFAVASASPELMMAWRDGRVACEPMKGTAPTVADDSGDRAARDGLLASEKDVAENVMIVDLLRNDLARVCATGSVVVSDLCRAERYPTVWQLVSRIEGELRAGLDAVDVLTALFPCGSITGAPKLASMLAIDELEAGPRGIYCGSIGLFDASAGSFNVAIRTASIDKSAGTVRYGAGGGITWSSDPAAEWDELVTKSRVLDARAAEPVRVLETARWDDDDFPLLERHVERGVRTCRELGLGWTAEQIRDAFLSARPTPGEGAVRVALGETGADVTSRPVPRMERVRLALADRRVRSDDPWRSWKTTHRRILDEARARRPDVDDVVFLNERGFVTETSIFTIAALVEGQWVTPPVTDGCLPGVLRAQLLDEGRLVERSLVWKDLLQADELAVLNSVRGWLPAVIA
ncbi:MAG: bifunctional anthranilate synthase component I family protein/class IV aminotransferase [Luteococcus sp.]|uniref:bifunctional anthranilate synthase component I family protein/class IV aminotransferase n=1 Tax=Luteococcus sp. TaxID=1969402 RepID=UPI0026498086|nr:bifunctional anthranilate synthase component I family protein/class IV aminotransferase [Luteococcus sp.]MDN5563652.1 bifunctional anthranilate synthase component I family protein/class IV aminotransferase [Luteococcus sp.]